MASASRSSRRNLGPRPITESTPVDVRQWVPTSTFSRAVMWGNSLMFWNVLATPALVTRSGRRGSGLPRKDTSPDVGVTSPVRQLKNVVLPAPLGPISPTISPSPTVEVDGVDRQQPAEALGHRPGLEQRRHVDWAWSSSTGP